MQQFQEETVSAPERDELRDLLNDQRNDPGAIEYLKQVQEKTALLPTHSTDRLGRLMDKINALEADGPKSEHEIPVVRMPHAAVPSVSMTEEGVPVISTPQHQVPVVKINERRRWKRYTAAAVTIICIAAGALYLFTNNKPGPSLATVAGPSKIPIIPGGNKATLTLGNGTTLVLDSTSNGLLANQGNVQVM